MVAVTVVVLHQDWSLTAGMAGSGGPVTAARPALRPTGAYLIRVS